MGIRFVFFLPFERGLIKSCVQECPTSLRRAVCKDAHQPFPPLRATQPYYTNQAILERRRCANTSLHPRLLDTRGSVSKSKSCANLFKSRCVHRTPSSFFTQPSKVLEPQPSAYLAARFFVLRHKKLNLDGCELPKKWDQQISNKASSDPPPVPVKPCCRSIVHSTTRLVLRVFAYLFKVLPTDSACASDVPNMPEKMKYSECSCALVRDPIQHSPAWHFPRVHHGPENFPLKAILELQPWRNYFRTMLRQPCLRFAQFAVSCNYAS